MLHWADMVTGMLVLVKSRSMTAHFFGVVRQPPTLAGAYVEMARTDVHDYG
jgi:hypothetical protein